MSDRPENVCTGILVDVSGSMKGTVERPSTGQSESWSRSIFRTVDDMIANDVRPENQTFVIAFGGSKKLAVFDLLNTLQNLSPPLIDDIMHCSSTEIVEIVVENLKHSGAKYIRSWADVDMIVKNITKPKAKLLFGLLENYQFKPGKHYLV